jgi:glycosyltransferase involved in cell wall biosynthesis
MERIGRVPLVSVIVPARNSERFVGATLHSIQVQTFRDWECILVDDGSADATTRIAEGFASRDGRFRVVRRGRMGKSLSRNEGFFRAHPGASYVSFMDSDDVWVPEALEVLVNRLEKSSEAVGVHGLGDFIDTRGVCRHPGAFADYGRRRRVFRGEGARELLEHESTTLESLAWVGTVFPPGVLLARRKKFLCGALYDPGLRHCEDWDVSIRLSRQGPIAFVNRVVLGYRRHDSNESNDWNGMRCYVRKVHHKTFFSDSNSPEQRRMLREGWRAFQCFKLREKWDLGWQHSGWARWRAFSRAALAAPVHWSRYCRGSPPGNWGELPGAALPP